MNELDMRFNEIVRIIETRIQLCKDLISVDYIE